MNPPDTLAASREAVAPEIAANKWNAVNPSEGHAMGSYPGETQGELDVRMQGLMDGTAKGDAAADHVLGLYKSYREGRGETPFQYVDRQRQLESNKVYAKQLPFFNSMFSESFEAAFPEAERQGISDSFNSMPSPDLARKVTANKMLVSEMTGRTVDELDGSWEVAKAAYAKQAFGHNKGAITDEDFHKLASYYIAAEWKDHNDSNTYAARARASVTAGRPIGDVLKGVDNPDFQSVIRQTYADTMEKFTDDEILLANKLYERDVAKAQGQYTEPNEENDKAIEDKSLERQFVARDIPGRDRIRQLMAYRMIEDGYDVQGFFQKSYAATAASAARVGQVLDSALSESTAARLASTLESGVVAIGTPAITRENALGTEVLNRGAALPTLQGFMDTGKTRPLTFPERKVLEEIHADQAARRDYMGDMATSGLRIARAIDEENDGFWMKASLQAYGSLPEMGLALIPAGAGLPVIFASRRAEARSSFQRSAPDASPEAVENMANATALGQTATMSMERFILGARLPRVGAALKSAETALANFTARGAWRTAAGIPVRAGAVVGFEMIQENTENIVPDIVQAVGSALSEDIKGVDFGAVYERQKKVQGDIFGASLIFGIFAGTGRAIGDYADGPKIQKAMMDTQGIRLSGLPAAKAKEISEMAETRPLDAAQAYQDAFNSMSDEELAANSSTEARRMQAAANESEQSKAAFLPEIVEREDGKTLVRWNNLALDEDVYDTPEQAVEAMRTREREEEVDASRFNRAEIEALTNEEVTRIADALPPEMTVNSRWVEPESMAQWAGDSAPRIAQARERIRYHLRNAANDMGMVIDDADPRMNLEDYFITGSSRNIYQGGMTEIAVTLSKGKTGSKADMATPLKAVEEVAHGVAKHLRDVGGVPINRQIEWVRSVEQNSSRQLMPGDISGMSAEAIETSVDEAIAEIAQAYAVGRVTDENVPSGLLSFLKAFKALLTEILRLAKDIRSMRERGLIDEDFQSYLDTATGFSEQGAFQRQNDATTSEITESADSFAIQRKQPLDENLKGLTGKIATVEIPGRGKVTFGAYPKARLAAESYMRKAGLVYAPPTTYQKVEKMRAKRIAEEYARMEHAPNDPLVRIAYQAMIEETVAQYRSIIEDTGLKVEAIKGDDPYEVSPRLAVLDVIENNHLWFFRTADGFGSSEMDVSDNPLLAPTGIYLEDGAELLANDVFRIVHDYFGHIKEGVGFRADGEEQAWRMHSAMYSPLARLAMTSETRGQNSWVNFGPHGEANQKAGAGQTVFADQKTGLLPEWVAYEGAGDPEIDNTSFAISPKEAEWIARIADGEDVNVDGVDGSENDIEIEGGGDIEDARDAFRETFIQEHLSDYESGFFDRNFVEQVFVIDGFETSDRDEALEYIERNNSDPEKSELDEDDISEKFIFDDREFRTEAAADEALWDAAYEATMERYDDGYFDDDLDLQSKAASDAEDVTLYQLMRMLDDTDGTIKIDSSGDVEFSGRIRRGDVVYDAEIGMDMVKANGRATLEFDSLFPRSHSTNRVANDSLGLELAAKAIIHGRRLGFDEITTQGARSDSSNTTGYLTWPRLGFEYRRPIHLALQELGGNVDRSDADKVADIARAIELGRIDDSENSDWSLLKLTSTKEGLKLWREHGGSIYLRFDLTPGSESIKRFSEFLSGVGRKVIRESATREERESPRAAPVVTVPAVTNPLPGLHPNRWAVFRDNGEILVGNLTFEAATRTVEGTELRVSHLDDADSRDFHPTASTRIPELPALNPEMSRQHLIDLDTALAKFQRWQEFGDRGVLEAREFFLPNILQDKMNESAWMIGEQRWMHVERGPVLEKFIRNLRQYRAALASAPTFAISSGSPILDLVENMANATGSVGVVGKRMRERVAAVADRARHTTPSFWISVEDQESALADLDAKRETEIDRHEAALDALQTERDTARETARAGLMSELGERWQSATGEHRNSLNRLMRERVKNVEAQAARKIDAENAAHARNLKAINDREAGLMRSGHRADESMARFQQLNDIATLEAVAKSLPSPLRGATFTDEDRSRESIIGGFKKLSEMRSPEKRQEYLMDLLGKVERGLESYLANQFKKAIEKRMKAAEPKVGDSRTATGRIGAEGHDVFRAAKEAMTLTQEEAEARSAAIISKMEAGSPTMDELEAMDAQAAAYDLLYDFENANSARLEEALEFLNGVYAEGRAAWLGVLQDRAERRAYIIDTLARGLGKEDGVMTQERAAAIAKSKGFLAKLDEGIMGAMISGSQTFRRLGEMTDDPEVRSVIEEMERAFAEAEINESAANRLDNERVAAAMRAIFNVSTDYQLAKKLHDLQTAKGESPVTKIEGAIPAKEVSIPLEFAEAIALGQARGWTPKRRANQASDPEPVSLTDEEVAQVESAWEAFQDLDEDSRKGVRSIKIKTPGSDGERMSIGEFSQLEGLQLLLTMRQPDQAEKMEAIGYDGETLDEIQKWLKPEVIEFGNWMVEYLKNEQVSLDSIHRFEKGVGLGLVDQYFPVRNEVAAADISNLDVNGSPMQSGRSTGFIKGRVDNRKDIAITNAIGVFLAHRAQVNFWKSHVAPIREWGSVLTNDRFASVVRATMGADYYKSLTQLLKRIEGGGRVNAQQQLDFERAVKSLMRGFAVGTLGGRVSTLLVNTSAVLNATYEIPAADLMKGLALVVKRPEAFKDAWNSPAIKRRMEEGSSFEMQLAKAKGISSKPLISILNKASQPAMDAINLVDTVSNTASAAVVWEYTRTQAVRTGMSEDTARSLADQKVEDVMRRAAQPTLRISKSEIEQRALENPIMALFALFISEPRKNAAITYLAARKLITGKGEMSKGMATQQLVVSLLLYSATEFTLRSIYTAFANSKPEDEDELWKRLTARMTDWKAWGYKLTTGHLTGVPFWGQVWDEAMKTSWSQPQFSGGNNPGVRAVEAAFKAGDILDDEATTSEKIDGGIKAAQGLGSALPGGPLFAQFANVFDFLKSAAETSGVDLSEQDMIDRYKARFSKENKRITDIHGTSDTKEIAKEKHDAQTEVLTSMLEGTPKADRQKILDALPISETVRKGIMRNLGNSSDSKE